ncbi:MHYT domain-containing protein [Actinocrispum wychmicini]|uniref:NO-binding membrane sensor protein with MHYT domain n=1 Tax=Actinocrispum wychmicini TaxID=1213861 RepID=A0A4R2JKU9_9PSEU|nr:MHYT domain-containing protein [Actinocrispum wychmicini]TCO60631.1 NO-binding membrane sensor protein with MHYT domain [Actinocrispum wychmicini]
MNPIHEMHHFTMGYWTLVLAYTTSVVGSLLGLSCMARARATRAPRTKALWTLLGAFAIGGIGIWLMHFIAMLGFSVSSMRIRYSTPITALSAVAAVAVVGLGLFVATWGRFRVWRLTVGGIFTGVGVAAMHYLGMSAMRMQGEVTYDSDLVLLSVVIAIVAGTAALWFTIVVRGVGATVLAGFVMGVAVTGMHYTGMAAMNMRMDPGRATPQGTEVFGLVFPVFLLGGLVIAVLLWALFTTQSRVDALKVAR